jgi:hypothetical protein
MATVTYKNQPAIHKTRGAVPPEGTTHIYKVTKLLWPKEIEYFLGNLLIGKSLHICCGKSTMGDVRLDLYEQSVDVRANADKLPFNNNAFDTLLIDPPYNGNFQWNHDMLCELGRVSKQRFIFQHWFSPVDKFGRFKKDHSFILTDLYNWMPKSYFGRMQIISIFDKINQGE